MCMSDRSADAHGNDPSEGTTTMLLLAAQAWLVLTVITGTLLVVVLTVGRVVAIARRLRAVPAPWRSARFPRPVSSHG